MNKDSVLICILMIIFFIAGIFTTTVTINGNELGWFWSGIAGLLFYGTLTLAIAALISFGEFLFKTFKNLRK